MSPLSQLIASLVLAGVGLTLFFGGEFHALDLPLGFLGTWLYIAAAWFFVDALHRIPKSDAELAIAPGEWQSWVGLAFTTAVLVAIAQKAHLFNLPAPIYENVDAGRAGRSIGTLFIAWLVLAEVLKHRWNARVQVDERDRQIEQKASAWGRCTSTFVIIAIAVFLGFSPTVRLQQFSYPLLAQMLLCALLLGAWIDQAATAWLYWRDRRAVAVS